MSKKIQVTWQLSEAVVTIINAMNETTGKAKQVIADELIIEALNARTKNHPKKKGANNENSNKK